MLEFPSLQSFEQENLETLDFLIQKVEKSDEIKNQT